MLYSLSVGIASARAKAPRAVAAALDWEYAGCIDAPSVSALVRATAASAATWR